MNVVFAYLIPYVALVGGVVFVGFLLHVRKSRSTKNEKRISREDITVIVPFRNEEKRLDALLSSILNANSLPKQFIFVDDHSDDGSAKLIQTRLGSICQLVKAPENCTGKKKALREGIKKCDTKYILTFDADISFEPNYFSAIEQLEEADMYVLPAILVGNTFSELIYELDVALANALNTGLTGWSRPIFCSGANLLYKREAFYMADDLDSHIHMASGDDTYLLRDFRITGKDVRLETSLNLAISTETPHAFREFIDQRLRWVGKTTDIGDSLATLAAVGQFCFAMAFFALLIYLGMGGAWKHFFILFAAKIGLDLLFFFPYFSRIQRIQSWWLIPIYELFFPIYSLLLGVLMLGYRPKWKGREIQS